MSNHCLVRWRFLIYMLLYLIFLYFFRELSAFLNFLWMILFSEILSSSEPSLPSTESEEGAIFSPPSGFFRKSLWIVSLPILVGGYLTIPDCRKSRWEKWFFATFFISCTWIGFMSYILVWMITIIGKYVFI